MSNNNFNILRKKKFLPLFITQFFGACNDNLFKNALMTLITFVWLNKYGLNDKLLVLTGAGLFILPMVIFSALAGEISDKYCKQKLIFYNKISELIIVIFAVIGLYYENITFLLATLFFLGCQSTFFGPLKYSILPEHLKKNELLAGNALVEMATFIAILLGTILGTSIPVLKNFGLELLSFLLILFSIFGVVSSYYIPKTTPYPDIKINFNIFKSSYEIIKYTYNKKTLFTAIVGISWFWLIGSLYVTEFQSYTKHIINGDASIVALLLTTFSIGIGIGSLFCNKLLKGRVETTFVPLGLLGMALFGLYFYKSSELIIPANTLIQFISYFSNWHTLIALLGISICGGIYIVPLYAVLQEKSDKQYRARIIACNNILNALFMVLGALCTGILLYFNFTLTDIFLFISILTIASSIYITKILPFELVQSFFRIIFHFLFKLEVNGLENYEKAGKRVVIVANHSSLLDGLILSAILPDKVMVVVDTFMAKKWWVKFPLMLADAYFIDPTNPMAIKSLVKEVKKNKKCLIFPEGRITVTGSLMKINEGPGVIADKANAKILPINIAGAQYTIFSYLKGVVKTKLSPKITVTIHQPEDINIPYDIFGKERRNKISSKLYDIMVSMTFSSIDKDINLFQSLLDAKKLHGGNHIILEDINREPLSYNKFIFKSFLLANLIKYNIKSCEKIGIMLPNINANAILYFALQSLGAVPAMLNFSTGIKNILSSCNAASIKQIYTSKKFIEQGKLDLIIKNLLENNIKIIYLEDLKKQVSIIKIIKAYFCSKFPYFLWTCKIGKKIKSTDMATILFTSGSEGVPKGVALSHKNLQSNRMQLSSVVDFNPKDIILNALPMFHSFGLSAGTILPILSGVRTFLYPSPLHYRVIPVLSYNINATIIFGTNTFLAGYAKYAHQYDFYSLRYVFAGAEKLQDEVRQAFASTFGVRILEGYGATETSPVLATNTPMYNKINTVGKFLPNIQYKIEKVPGVKEGGKLLVKGPNIMLGYLLIDSPKKIIKPENGWYDTGDIIKIDENGFIKIIGRAKRFAKIGGEMISLTAVETFISEIWHNETHAAISVPDLKKGEQIILATTYKNADKKLLTQLAKEKGFSELFVPKSIVILDKIPVLGTGKINYVELKEQLEK